MYQSNNVFNHHFCIIKYRFLYYNRNIFTNFLLYEFYLHYNIASPIQTVDQTLVHGTGSCRDFAKLFMEAARCIGIASRFVSGYLYVPQTTDINTT